MRRNKNTPENVVALFLKDFESYEADSVRDWCGRKGYSPAAVRWRAKQQGVALPSRANCKLDREVAWQNCLDLVDGHLLGDASIIKPKKDRESYVFQISCKHRDYLDWLTEVNPFLQSANVYFWENADKRTGETYSRHWLKSRASNYLSLQRQRWYPNDKKAIPHDVQLTPGSLLRFYLEDGSVATHGGLALSVHDFIKTDVEYLRQKIAQVVNVDATIHSEAENPAKIYIRKQDAKCFLDYIGLCPIESLRYKFAAT